MTIKKRDIQAADELFEVILSLETKEDCRLFFDDLCTIREVEQMAQRLKAARLMMEGKTYHEVTGETDISSATLSRISRCIQYGEGYNKFVQVRTDEDVDENGTGQKGQEKEKAVNKGEAQ